ncbi:Glycoside hydrolase family 20, catalytic domain [Dillenia turbinata]|uniref:Beta-hexosaminidase n=1 Tax=Dillenia turbinata TaxID=194707 RepID=A0AAN8VEX3_9MAGN
MYTPTPRPPYSSSYSIHLVSAFITLIGLGYLTHPVSAQINVWPKPRSLSWPTPQAISLSPAFAINDANSCPNLSTAVNRYQTLVRSEKHRPLLTPALNISDSAPLLQTLTVLVADPGSPLQHGVDESYTLRIPAANRGTGANLTAKTVWGAMRGLETFSQLVWAWGGGDRPLLLLVASGLEVWDAPLFPHRGLLLDTSRNYYPIADILRTIEAMSANKLNVFHWHITDSQSFPLLLPSEPDLALKGSYGPGMMYSPADIHRVVRFGLDRGVRVLPEIDTPGHTGSWAAAYPEIVACANMFWWPAGSEWADRLASEPGTGHLNPLIPKTYEILRKIFSDMANLFPEQFYHAGADEVIPGCWKVDPTISKFLSDGGTLNQVLEKFINSTFPDLVSLNRTVVYWEDVLLDPNVNVSPTILPPDHTILQTWNNGPNNTMIVRISGHCSDPGNGGSWCGPFKTWQTIYNYDITYGLNDKESKLVLGGEVALWSEQADPTVLDARVWPRTSALAETLWSGNRDEKGMKRYAEATDRLNEWRHRMVSRGIKAEPIQPLWCIRNPGICNTVHPFE